MLIELFGLVYRMFGELTETKKNIKSTVTWLKMKLSQISKSSDDYEAIQIQIKSYQDIIEYIENLISEAIETIDTINTLVENPNINTQDELETLSTIMRLIVDSFEEQVEIIGERLSITSTTISNIYNSHEASDIKEELESLYRRVERVKSLQEDIERLQLEQDLLVQNHAAHTQINELQEKTQAANREKKIKQMALIKAKDQLKELQQAQHSQEKHKEAISLSHDEINNHQNRINELNQAISKILANAGDLKIQFMKYINLHEKNELLQQKILSLSNSVEDQELIFQDNSINEVVREIEQNELEISSLLSKIYSFFIQNGESLVLINPDIQEMMNSIILNPEITSTQKIQSLIELVSVIAKDGASNIKELNSKINDLTHENELISVTNIDYEADIRGIQLTIQGIELEINDINQRLGVYDQQISDLRQCLNPAQQEIERFEEQYSALEETIRMSRASLTETPTIEQNLSEMQLLETRLMSIEDRDDELILENASNIMLDNLLQYQEILYWVPSYATPLVNTLLFITELSTTHAHNHI